MAGGGEGERVRLFVGQVPRSMAAEQILAVLRGAARVDEAAVIRDRATGASRGCCFVVCPSREEADKAIAAYHNKCTLPGASRAMQVKYADGELERIVTKQKLFVGMLPRSVQEHEVSALFSQYGNIRELKLLRSPQKTSKAACAILEFESKEHARAAIEALNGKRVLFIGSSANLVVKLADTEKERQARKAQKAQAQASNLLRANLGPQLSIFGAPQMRFGSPSYDVLDYQVPGHYGCPKNLLQNQTSYNTMYPHANHGNLLHELDANIFPRTDPKISNLIQSAGYIRPPFPALPGLQYPGSYAGALVGDRLQCFSGGSKPNAHSYHASSAANTKTGRKIEGPPRANLFVYDIPQEYGDGELANLFQEFGRILSTKVFIDKTTGVSKCFGFVSYDTPESAQAAIKRMNGSQLGGKMLKVQLKRET
ncbi:hypothetical protein ABZP36_002214 [Zizania latifolia]